MKNPAIAAIELIDNLFCNGQVQRESQFKDAVVFGCNKRLDGESSQLVDSLFQRESTRLNVSLSSFWCQSGFLFFGRGRYDLAIEYLEKALRRKDCDQMPEGVALGILKALAESKAMMAAINQIQ